MKKTPYIFYSKKQFWESHNITFPGLIKTLMGLGCKPFEFWPGVKLSSSQIAEIHRRASHLIMLPHVHQSLTLLEQLRTFEATAQIPTVIVSASQSTSVGVGLTFYRKTLRQSDVFVVPSSAEKCSLTSILKGQNPIFQCPYPILSDELPKLFKSATLDVRRKLGLDTNDHLITYVGRLTPQKNIEVMIDALKILRTRKQRTKLLLVGGFVDEYSPVEGFMGGREYEAKIKNKIRELDLVDQVLFSGFISHKKALTFLAASDISLSLSTYAYDDFGRAVAEGISMNIPTVATRWGGSLDFISLGGAHGIPLVFKKNRPTVSAATVAKVLTNVLAQEKTPRHNLHRTYFGPTAVQKKWRQILRAATAAEGMQNIGFSIETSQMIFDRVQRAFDGQRFIRSPRAAPLYESYQNSALQKHFQVYSGRLRADS